MLLDGMKPGDMVVQASGTTFNTVNINLVGLAETGIELTPVNCVSLAAPRMRPRASSGRQTVQGVARVHTKGHANELGP